MAQPCPALADRLGGLDGHGPAVPRTGQGHGPAMPIYISDAFLDFTVIYAASKGLVPDADSHQRYG